MKTVKTSAKCFCDSTLHKIGAIFTTDAYDDLDKLPSYLTEVKLSKAQKAAIVKAKKEADKKAQEDQTEIDQVTSTASDSNFLDSSKSGEVESL